MITDLPKYIGIFILILIASIASNAQTYYWVGNGGNWNNASNWSATSGGAGGIGVPTATVNVVFDNGSGNCSIDASASCASIILNTTGTLTVNDILTITDTLLHDSGGLILNQRVETGSYISTTSSNRSLSGANMTFYINGEPGSFIIDPLNYLGADVDTLIFFSTNAILESGGETVINYLEFKGNGEIYGDNQMTLGVFANGYSVFLENGKVQTIYDEIITGDFCDGLAIISAFLTDPATAILRWESSRTPFPRGFYFRRIRGEDIVNGRANDVRYSDGVDGGDNDNISINTGNEVPQRTLYWVGGQGTWRDRSHWSLTSGGTGGECIPTAKDIVNFDNNSFNGPGDLVSSNAEVYISEFNYTSSSLPGIFSIPALNIRRSLNLQQPLIWDIPTVNLVGVDNTVDLTLTTNNNVLNDMNVISLRNVTLKDNLNLNGTLNFENFSTSARFRSFGFDINVGRFIADGSEMGLDLANSYIMVNSLLANGTLDMPLTIRNSDIFSTNNTRWELTAPSSGFEVSSIDLGSVWFSEPDGDAFAFGTGEVLLQSLRFEGNGRIFQENYIIDSLIFTPGHTYTAEADKEIAVNFYFESLGDLCQPISFQSNGASEAADFFMPSSASVEMSYTNIENIHATGGNSFDAGIGSIDRGGNLGWSFRDPDAVDRNEFLGPDTLFCNDLEGSFRIFLDYSLDEVDSVQFNDGLTEPFNRSPYVQTFPVNGLSAQSFDVVARLVFDNGCFALDTVTVTIDESFTIDIGTDQTICNNDSITLQNLNGEEGVSYSWSDGSNLETLSVSSTGTYTVMGQRGACEAEDEVDITKIDLTDLSIGNDTILCEVETLTLNAPTDFTGEITWSTGSKESSIDVIKTDIFWADFTQDICTYRDSVNVRIESSFDIDLGGDTTLCNGASITLNTGTDSGVFQWSSGQTAPLITVTEGGTYSVDVQIGSCRATDTIEIKAIALKPFSLGIDTTLCETDPYALSIPDGFQGNFSWSTGETTEEILASAEGDYTLTLSEDICEISDTIVISFDPEINLNLGSDTTLCTGEILTLRSGIAEADSYFWNTGETTETITISDADTYSVIVERGACIATDEIEVSYINVDNFSIGADTILCEGETLVLSADLSSAATYQWQDGSMLDSFLVSQGGRYTVIANLENCSASAEINVNYQTPVDINLGEDITLCEPNSIVLDATRDGATYLWQDGSTDPTLLAASSDIYVVTVNDAACTLQDSIVVTIQDLPNISIAGTDALELCDGDSIILSAFANGVSYVWQDLSTTPEYIARETGLYFAEMRLGVCVVRDSIDINFNPNPVVTLRGDTTICEGTSVTLSLPQLSGANYSWTGISSTNDQVSVSEAGTYQGTVTSDKGCTSSDEFVLIVNPTPVFELGDDVAICDGDPATITAQPSYPNMMWNVAGSGSTITTTMEGVVVATADLAGCVYSDSVNVTVQSYPVIELGNDTIICERSELVLSAETTGASYTWNTGETSPMVTATGSGTFIVDVNLNGCITTDRINIETKETPDFELAADRTICEDEEYTLSIANPGSWDVSWNNGETTDDIIISENGTYTATATLNGCSSTDDFVLSIQPLPEFDLGETIRKCEDLSTILTVERNDVEVVWQDGTIGNSITASNPGLYTAVAMTSIGCTFTDEVEVENRECVNFTIYIPNAFSPNGDNVNDEYITAIPEGTFLNTFEMRIFDRWGNQIFQSNDINVPWLGNGGGFTSLQPGVYAYVITLNYSDDYVQGIDQTYKGNITLIE